MAPVCFVLLVPLLVTAVPVARVAAEPVSAVARNPVDPVREADFDGDGYADLALVSQNWNHEAGRLAEAFVDVLLGSPGGLATDGPVRIDVADIPGLTGFTSYVSGLAGADFNGDGYSDLAIGTPSASVAGVKRAGAVHVVPGSATGLEVARTTSWSAATPGVPGAAEPDDLFGLAAGGGRLREWTGSGSGSQRAG